jgi:hypothetical protein
MSLEFVRWEDLRRLLVPIIALMFLLSLTGTALARHDTFGGAAFTLAFAPYTEQYAPYTAGPVIHESDLALYAPYTEKEYAPYGAGPVVHGSDVAPLPYGHYPLR